MTGLIALGLVILSAVLLFALVGKRSRRVVSLPAETPDPTPGVHEAEPVTQAPHVPEAPPVALQPARAARAPVRWSPSVVVLDVETTGLSAEYGDRVVEIGLVRLGSDLRVEREYTTLINPRRKMGATRIHGIREADVADAPTFADIAGDVGEFLGGAIIAAHNAPFDVRFLLSEFEQAGLSHRMPSEGALAVVDTLQASRNYIRGVPNYKLPTVCAACGIPEWSHHGALGDARATALLLTHLVEEGGFDLARGFNRGSVRLEPGWTGLAPTGRTRPRQTLAKLAKPAGGMPVPTTRPLPLAGEVAVFTGGIGIAREEAIRAAEMLGCRVTSAVSGKTSIVVVGDPEVGRLYGAESGISGKHRSALERAEEGQRVRVLAESDFMRLAEVVSDGVITEKEWHAVRELVYSPSFPLPDGSITKRARARRGVKKPSQVPPESASTHEWKSLPFLQTATAASPQDALKLLEEFIEAFKADVNGFSGTHSMAAVEEYVRTVATAPGVLNAFMLRTPGLAPFAPNLTTEIAKMALDAVTQTRRALESVDADVAAKDDTRSAMRVTREVEQELRA